MPYVPVPKDLSKVKKKVAFNLTRRQLVCFSLAGLVGVPSYLLLKTVISTDIAAIIMILLMLPFFFFAMYEKHGIPFEKVALNVLRVNFLTPKNRPYQTENLYAALDQHRNWEDESVVYTAKNQRNNPAYLPHRRRKGKTIKDRFPKGEKANNHTEPKANGQDETPNGTGVQ